VEETKIQSMINKADLLTTSAGNPIADNQNSITAGARGPLLMQDYQLLEKLAHQNRERIPERTVHAKGSRAYGTLTIMHDITRYSKASVFARIGKKTECLLRFSTVAGERGAADAERDVRVFHIFTFQLLGWYYVSLNVLSMTPQLFFCSHSIWISAIHKLYDRV